MICLAYLDIDEYGFSSICCFLLLLLICSGTIGEKEKGGRMPKHVAIILDGHRRWAEKRGLGPNQGQEAGARAVMENIKDYFSMGINTVSLFAFSTGNWGRPGVNIEI